ncbi:uncharacterized protein Pyn_28672 [Prunus yedoensis var. nudiflora]|uniref:Uncharacterized protein n=1 Tax=Prunus yedoensis var. nudiflora TaxID=2094558 RepID=A0A314YT36_PRUYE|nr:uncharacterized protein Pyn_28672 [Prunus yedoensis var. nudiflora]
MTVRRDELDAWFREIGEAISAVDLEKFKLKKEVIRLIEETTTPNIPLIVYDSTNNDNNIVNPYPRSVSGMAHWINLAHGGGPYIEDGKSGKRFCVCSGEVY